MRNSTIIALCLMSWFCNAQQSFLTTWMTDNTGTSNSTSITIPTHPGHTYNYDVDWDFDSVYDEIGITGTVTHDFGSPGEKRIAIRGDFPRIYFNNGGDKLKLISIDRWGDNVWENMNSAFEGCANLEELATDAPDLSIVASMSEMFWKATGFTGDISNWDVSQVPWMVSMFKDAAAFNSDLSAWDMSSVNSIRNMFAGASSFNQDISGWDMSNITNLEGVLHDATAFDQNLGSWDINQAAVSTVEELVVDYSNWTKN